MSLFRVPGGIQVPITLQNTQESYYRVADMIGVVMAPFKMILNFIEFFIKLQEALEAVVDIVSDPTNFVDKLEVLQIHVTKLLQYVPQLSVPLMIGDSLKLVYGLLGVILDQLAVVSNIASKVGIAEYLVEGFPEMEFLVEGTTNQLATSILEIEKMIGPLTDVINVINSFGSLINFELPIPTLDVSNISTLEANILQLRGILKSIIESMGETV